MPGGVLSLSLPVASQSTSIVVVQAVADSVQFVVNASPGRISNASLCTFDGAVCGGFQAGASRGYLSAIVENTGHIAAAFTLAVSVLWPGSKSRGVQSLPGTDSSVVGESRALLCVNRD